MSNTLKIISLAAWLSCMVFAFILLYFTAGKSIVFTVQNGLGLMGLSAGLFLLPEFLSDNFYDKNNFFKNSIFYTLISLFIFTIVGFLLKDNSYILSSFITIASIYLLLKSIKPIFKEQHSVKLLFTTATFLLFLVGIVYCAYPAILPLEFINSGKVHIDLMMHCSITNMIDTFGKCTMGLDGNTTFTYHWASHLIFAGLKNYIGGSALHFYCFGYAILFVPLFVKAILYCIEFLSSKPNQLLIFVALAILAVGFSSDFFLYFGQPLGSESYTLSLTFSLMLFGILLITWNEIVSWKEIIFICCMLYFIAFTKISVGITTTAIVGYIYLRHCYSLKNYLLLSSLTILLCVLVYFTIYPHDRATAINSVMHRYEALWVQSRGILTYTFGALMLFGIMLYSHELKSRNELIQIFKSKKYLLYEALAIATIVGFVCSIKVSSHPNDVIYFSGNQLYYSLPLFIFLCYKIFDKFKAVYKTKIYFSIAIIFFSMASLPEVGKSLLRYNDLKKENLTTDIYGQFLKSLYTLSKTNDKEKKCIYINKNESWFYKSQLPDGFEYRDDVEAASVVPAVSGIVMLGGIPQNVLDSPYPYYGVYYHRLHRNKQINTLEEGLEVAKKEGYTILIEFKSVNGKLEEKVYHL